MDLVKGFCLLIVIIVWVGFISTKCHCYFKNKQHFLPSVCYTLLNYGTAHCTEIKDSEIIYPAMSGRL